MDDQRANRNRGAIKQFVDDAKGQQQIGWVAWKYSWWPTIKSPRFLGCLLLVVVVAISIYLAIPAIQHARYERAMQLYGGRRFTRSQAMRQIDNQTVYLLPDSEFKPEKQTAENNSNATH